MVEQKIGRIYELGTNLVDHLLTPVTYAKELREEFQEVIKEVGLAKVGLVAGGWMATTLLLGALGRVTNQEIFYGWATIAFLAPIVASVFVAATDCNEWRSYLKERREGYQLKFPKV